MGIKNSQNDEINGKIKDYLTNFERLPCGVAVAKNDEFFTIIKSNPAFHKIIGHTEEQFQKNHENKMTNIIIDSIYDAFGEQIKEENKDYDIEWDLRIRKADGSIAWVHDAAHYNAELNVFFLIYTDITDKMIATARHLSYEAFQIRNGILGDINLYTPEHITVTDIETDEVLYMNPSASNLLGCPYESDWKGKAYWELVFGDKESVDKSYYKPLTESEFTVREYYNKFHNIYVSAKSRIVTVPRLKRKLRLNVITDITAQKRLEDKISLQKTLNDCVHFLFTTETTTGKEAEDAYYDILNQLKKYYHSDGAFFYKFKEGTYEVEAIYKVLEDGVKSTNHKLPMTMSEEKIKMMQALSETKSSDNQTTINSFSDHYQEKIKQKHAEYKIDDFVCVAVNNNKGNIMAFMGVTNPQTNEDTKELMELLSRFICMFMEHQQHNKIKDDALKLEKISKINLVETCVKNFEKLEHPKKNINSTLDTLCYHYNADFAVILMNNEEGDCKCTYVGGQNIPDLTGIDNQPKRIMERWAKMFESQQQFITDVDFVDLSSSNVKRILHEKYGIYNFIVSPIQDEKGSLTGLLFLNNFKLLNRSRLMVHVVAKNISDYLAKFSILEETRLEPLTKLSNKVATQNRISRLLKEGREGTLFIIDMDNFKQLNDTLGHSTGDTAIIDVANILKTICGDTDVVGRIGGDEFMVFAPDLMEEGLIENKAKLILEKCNLTYEKDGLSVEISTSIGICSVNDKCRKYNYLYERSDKALYIAKKNGKNRFNIYNEEDITI